MSSSFFVPPPLQKGDKIIITAPAGRISADKTFKASEYLRAKGYKVEIMPHTAGTYHMFSGTDAERLADLQQAMDDVDCRVILMARGGYGLVRIIDKLDMRGFLAHPKWVVGFSDITHIHARLQGFSCQSIHGPMAAAFMHPDSSGALQLLSLLSGERCAPDLTPHYLNRSGMARGMLVGGNLSILVSLLGTPDEPETDERILFLEDVGEYMYRLDRMLHTLKRARKLDRLAGLVVGGFSEMKDGDPGMGLQAEQLVRQTVEEYGYPVAFGLPAGHLDFNFPLVLGAEVLLKVDENSVEFNYL